MINNKTKTVIVLCLTLLTNVSSAITLETGANVIPTATSTPSEKSITVDKTSIEFGNLYPGNSNTISIIVKNNGNVSTDVQISASNMIAKNVVCAQVVGIDCPPKISASSITVNDISIDKAITIITNLEPGNSQTISIKLNVEPNTQAADYAGSITILPI